METSWVQVLTIVGANVGLCLTLFLWIRKEANADRKELRSVIDTHERVVDKMMLDFHGKLCALDERSRK